MEAHVDAASVCTHRELHYLYLQAFLPQVTLRLNMALAQSRRRPHSKSP